MNKDFFDAIRTGDAARVAEMIDADCELLNAPDDNGMPPYTVARYSRQDTVAKLLLERGAQLDINSAAMAGLADRIADLLAHDRTLVQSYSHDGWTPLHLASFFGSVPSAEVLLSHSADVHARSRNNMNNTPLHAAVAGRHLEIVKLLLAHSADVNAKQHGGWTPLHGAAQSGNLELVETLLGYGAAVQSRADNNQTPLDLALTGGHTAVVDILEGALAARQGA